MTGMAAMASSSARPSSAPPAYTKYRTSTPPLSLSTSPTLWICNPRHMLRAACDGRERHSGASAFFPQKCDDYITFTRWLSKSSKFNPEEAMRLMLGVPFGGPTIGRPTGKGAVGDNFQSQVVLVSEGVEGLRQPPLQATPQRRRLHGRPRLHRLQHRLGLQLGLEDAHGEVVRDRVRAPFNCQRTPPASLNTHIQRREPEPLAGVGVKLAEAVGGKRVREGRLNASVRMLMLVAARSVVARDFKEVRRGVEVVLEGSSAEDAVLDGGLGVLSVVPAEANDGV